MNILISFLITSLVTAISLIILSKLPLGIEIDSFGKALISGVVFGLLNGILRPILTVLGFPLIVLTLGLFLFVINVIIFGLAAKLVEGFRLRWGIWSAIIGAIALSIINSILFRILAAARIAV